MYRGEPDALPVLKTPTLSYWGRKKKGEKKEPDLSTSFLQFPTKSINKTWGCEISINQVMGGKKSVNRKGGGQAVP